MTLLEARIELRLAWAARPIDHGRIARAIAIVLELCSYDVHEYANQIVLVVDNTKNQNV